MRIGIQGWGSEGDLRPLLALGVRLRRRGHEVRLVLSRVDEMDYAPECREHDVQLQMVPEQMAYSLRGICQASQSKDPAKVSVALMDQAFYPYLEQMYAAALELCGRSDVVLGLFSSFYVKAACLKTGTPFACVHYYPGLIPSREMPPEGFPSWRWLHPVSWALVGKLIDMAFLKPAAKFYASKGLPRVRHALTDVNMSERLNLIGTSPALFTHPADWGSRSVLCGHFGMPEAAAPWQPTPALREFLEAGEKPILVSLGTMEHLAPERARDLVTSALRQAGVRAIVQTKVGGAGAEEGRDGDLFWLRWAPHHRLLRHCSAMVLHGGAGTTHAALRGGVPGVVLPFIFEQRLWGNLLHRAGSAPKPLGFWKATPEKLAALIREATTSEALRHRAAELGAKVADEDGAGVAAKLLENLELDPEQSGQAVTERKHGS
ncbi:MAG: glycosyltransferase family 1 protein [Deltaproteobacteria bacterium]|nr:glycosyltransferase family 1 protein [Deltaproteobacteria bacterium]